MKEKTIPMRRCVGCMESKEKHQLVRVAGYEGRMSADFTGRASGRGAYLCKDNPQCWEKAYKRRALERSLKMTITEEDKEAVFAQLKEMAGEKSE
ncbi:MAG: YlxR family protein [Firmicutes bacterium]|nr:YlxR family protein [Bacillota bacterium]